MTLCFLHQVTKVVHFSITTFRKQVYPIDSNIVRFAGETCSCFPQICALANSTMIG